MDGDNSGKKGTIVHIYKNIVFLYNPEQTINNGLYVDKTRNLVILGAEILKGNNEVNVYRRGKPNIAGGKNESLVTKTVRITEGPYKGYLGRVKECDKTKAKVELLVKAKIISIGTDCLKDTNDQYEPEEAAPAMPQVGARTPAYAPQSPTWAPSTPAAQSPAYPAYQDSKLPLSTINSLTME